MIVHLEVYNSHFIATWSPGCMHVYIYTLRFANFFCNLTHKNCKKQGLHTLRELELIQCIVHSIHGTVQWQ